MSKPYIGLCLGSMTESYIGLASLITLTDSNRTFVKSEDKTCTVNSSFCVPPLYGVLFRTSGFQLKESGFESSCCCFKTWIILFTPRCLSSLSCINEYLAIDSSLSCINEYLAIGRGRYVNG